MGVSGVSGSKVRDESEVDSASHDGGAKPASTAKTDDLRSWQENEVMRAEVDAAVGNDWLHGVFSGFEDDLRDEARGLPKGGKYSLGYNASALEFAGGQALTIEHRDQGDYEVTAKISGSMAEKADHAELSGSVGGSVFYRFKTPEGAADMASAFVGLATETNLAGSTFGMSYAATDWDISKRVADRSHLAGFEVTTELKGSFQLDAQLASVGGEAVGAAKTRIDLDDRSITFEQKVSFKDSASIGKLKAGFADGMSASFGKALGGEREIAGAMKSTVKLTDDQIQALRSGSRSPADVALEAFAHAKTELVLTGSVQAKVSSNAVKIELEKKIPFTNGTTDLSKAFDNVEFTKDVEMKVTAEKMGVLNGDVDLKVAKVGLKNTVTETLFKGKVASVDEGVHQASKAIQDGAKATALAAMHRIF